MGIFFSPFWHEFRVLVHNTVEAFFPSCMYVPRLQQLTTFDTPIQTCFYQFSFSRGVNWSHIKYPIFHTNWASGRFFHFLFSKFSFIYYLLYIGCGIRNVNKHCGVVIPNDKTVDIEIYSNLCTGQTAVAIARELRSSNENDLVVFIHFTSQ